MANIQIKKNPMKCAMSFQTRLNILECYNNYNILISVSLIFRVIILCDFAIMSMYYIFYNY